MFEVKSSLRSEVYQFAVDSFVSSASAFIGSRFVRSIGTCTRTYNAGSPHTLIYTHTHLTSFPFRILRSFSILAKKKGG